MEKSEVSARFHWDIASLLTHTCDLAGHIAQNGRAVGHMLGKSLANVTKCGKMARFSQLFDLFARQFPVKTTGKAGQTTEKPVKSSQNNQPKYVNSGANQGFSKQNVAKTRKMGQICS